jgi:hypothetical protein
MTDQGGLPLSEQGEDPPEGVVAFHVDGRRVAVTQHTLGYMAGYSEIRSGGRVLVPRVSVERLKELRVQAGFTGDPYETKWSLVLPNTGRTIETRFIKGRAFRDGRRVGPNGTILPPPQADTDLSAERDWRARTWAVLKSEGADAVQKARLRQLGAFGGAQGIWVDKKRTADLIPDGAGVAVAVLHTGSSYPDELSHDGLIYHYPETDRGSSRDAGEVEALKWSARLGLPIFVITPSSAKADLRQVRLGWVQLWDDQQKTVLISFSETPPPPEPPTEDLPFYLTATAEQRRALRKVRQGQQRFRFEVFQRYGRACVACGLAIEGLVHAAHLCPVERSGSNDPRNGLPMCVLHHTAFDLGHWAIDPATLDLRERADGPTFEDLRITSTSLKGLPALPHPAALEYLWQRWSNR